MARGQSGMRVEGGLPDAEGRVRAARYGRRMSSSTSTSPACAGFMAARAASGRNQASRSSSGTSIEDARVRRPLHAECVRPRFGRVQVALHRPRMHDLAAPLRDAAQIDGSGRGADDVAGLLAELAARDRPELLAVLDLALGDGPDARVAVLEVGSAGVAKQHLDAVGRLAEEQDARAHPGPVRDVRHARMTLAPARMPARLCRHRAGIAAPARAPRRPRLGSVGVALLLGRRGWREIGDLVHDLADGRPGLRVERRPARAPVGGHQAQQEDDGLAAEEQQDEREDEQRAADEGIPAPRHRERREDEEEGEQADLDPEAAQPRSSLGVERLTLVEGRLGGRAHGRARGGRPVGSNAVSGTPSILRCRAAVSWPWP